MSRQPDRTLFRRTVAILALTLLVFTLLAVGLTAWLVVFPVGKRSADDLAALMVLAAQTWVELPPGTDADFRQELRQQHQLQIGDDSPGLEPKQAMHPYMFFLEQSLQRRTGQPVTVMGSGDGRLWVDIPLRAGTVRIGFEKQRVGARPVLVLGLLLLTGVLVTLISAVVVARLMVRPLERVSTAVGEVGHGRMPPPLPESGPAEIVVLSRAINRMSIEVRELLQNRTVLLSGISHDLRTPLTRLRLAVEMLADTPGNDSDADLTLVDGMKRDLEAMDGLIAQFLELAQELGEVTLESVDLRELLQTAADDGRRSGAEISLHAPGPCRTDIHRASAGRIVANLLDNAIRYGQGEPITLSLRCEPRGIIIDVADRGAGIPEADRERVFRPFERLESARGRATGGSGLGLAIARQLADRHGWDLVLKPRDGGGTIAELCIVGHCPP